MGGPKMERGRQPRRKSEADRERKAARRGSLTPAAAAAIASGSWGRPRWSATCWPSFKESPRTGRGGDSRRPGAAPRWPDPDRYLGRGKITELKRSIKAAGANLVACDDELVPRQERNLEKELGVPVIDRTAVILDIFADHAGSAEGKLQVELAQLNTPWPGCAVSDPSRTAGGGPWEVAAARSPAPARLRSRPTGAWRGTGSQRCGAGSSGPSETARRCGSDASRPRCRPWRSPATPTRASQPC